MTINPHYNDNPTQPGKPKPDAPRPGDLPNDNPQQDNPRAKDHPQNPPRKEKPENERRETETPEQIPSDPREDNESFK